jgi:hypothetical protein
MSLPIFARAGDVQWGGVATWVSGAATLLAVLIALGCLGQPTDQSPHGDCAPDGARVSLDHATQPSLVGECEAAPLKGARRSERAGLQSSIVTMRSVEMSFRIIPE